MGYSNPVVSLRPLALHGAFLRQKPSSKNLLAALCSRCLYALNRD